MQSIQKDTGSVVIAEKRRVACDGDIGSGHPRVFLHIEHDTGEAVCPYCSRKFVLKNSHVVH